MSTETLSFATSNGATSAYVATPENPGHKAVIVIHEWWGLNDHIKDITNRYTTEGFIATASGTNSNMPTAPGTRTTWRQRIAIWSRLMFLLRGPPLNTRVFIGACPRSAGGSGIGAKCSAN